MGDWVKNLILVFLVVSCQESKNEYKPDYSQVLDSISVNYQEELDTGNRMLEITKKYQVHTDSLMKLIYKSTLALENIDTDSLEKSQKNFILKRQLAKDSLWAELDSISSENGFIPKDYEMIARGEISGMNFKRARELNELLKT